jgi:hypothetical protein
MILERTELQHALERAVRTELDRRGITHVQLPTDERVRSIIHRVRRKFLVEVAEPMLRERKYFKRQGHDRGVAYLTDEVRKLARECGLGGAQ